MPTILYNTAAELKAEAKMSNHTFQTNEVEQSGEEFEIIVENFTDKNRAASPTVVWLTTDREYPIIKLAARLGGAGLILQKFGNSYDQGQKKIDLAYKMLKNLVYGEGDSGLSSSGGSGEGFKGDVFVASGGMSNSEFEEIVNADLDGDSIIGSQ